MGGLLRVEGLRAPGLNGLGLRVYKVQSLGFRGFGVLGGFGVSGFRGFGVSGFRCQVCRFLGGAQKESGGTTLDLP